MPSLQEETRVKSMYLLSSGRALEEGLSPMGQSLPKGPPDQGQRLVVEKKY
jgi:hypothetical protein